jgi:uncharacterized protein YbjT (DUF2867 family)
MTMLVTGATGNVGSQVVRELQARGAPVRAFVRDPASLAGVELAVGDFADPESISRALAGVDRVFLSSADGPDKVAHEAAVIDAAAAAGVELIVKASTMLAQAGSPLKPLDWNARSEQHLKESGVPSVILASGFYMTNLLAAAEPVREQGVLPAPAGDGAVAMIDPRDVAAVAAVALIGDGHAGRTYRLTGPEALTYARIAEIVGAEYIDVPPEAARHELEAAGMPGWLLDHLDGAFALIRSGALAEVTDIVRAVTGREPHYFAAFARDHATLFAASRSAIHDGQAASSRVAIAGAARYRARHQPR